MVIIGTLKIDSAVCLIYSFNLVLDASLYFLIYDVNTSVPTLCIPVITRLSEHLSFPGRSVLSHLQKVLVPPHISLVYTELNIQNIIDVRSTKGGGNTWPFRADPVFSRRSVEAVSFRAPEPQGTDL